MHDEVSETENIRKNLAIERMIVHGCDILLDVNQVFVRQGTLIQVLCDKSRLPRARLGTFGSARERKETVRQVFLFTNHLLITARTSNGRLRLVKHYGKIPLLECTLVEEPTPQYCTTEEDDLAASVSSPDRRTPHSNCVRTSSFSSKSIDHKPTCPAMTAPEQLGSGSSLTTSCSHSKPQTGESECGSVCEMVNSWSGPGFVTDHPHRHSTTLCSSGSCSTNETRTCIDVNPNDDSMNNEHHTVPLIHRLSSNLGMSHSTTDKGEYENMDFRLIWEPKDGPATNIWFVASTLQEKAAWCSDISQCIEQLHFGDLLTCTQTDVSSVTLPQSVRSDPRLFNDDVDIKFSHTLNSCKVPQIRYATVDRLLDRLTDARFLSIDFLNTFLLTYRVFTTGLTVIGALQKVLSNLETELKTVGTEGRFIDVSNQKEERFSEFRDGLGGKNAGNMRLVADKFSPSGSTRAHFSLSEIVGSPVRTASIKTPETASSRQQVRRSNGGKPPVERLNLRPLSASTHPSDEHANLGGDVNTFAVEPTYAVSRTTSLCNVATKSSSPGQLFSPPPLIPRSPVFSGIFNIRDDPPLELPNLAELVKPRQQAYSKPNAENHLSTQATSTQTPRSITNDEEDISIRRHSFSKPPTMDLLEPNPNPMLPRRHSSAEEERASRQAQLMRKRSEQVDRVNLDAELKDDDIFTSELSDHSGSHPNESQTEEVARIDQSANASLQNHEIESDRVVLDGTSKFQRAQSLYMKTHNSEARTDENSSHARQRGTRLSISESLDLAIRLSCESKEAVNGACQALAKNAMVAALRCPGGLLQILSHGDQLPSVSEGETERKTDCKSNSPETPSVASQFQRSLNAFMKSFRTQSPAKNMSRIDANNKSTKSGDTISDAAEQIDKPSQLTKSQEGQVGQAFPTSANHLPETTSSDASESEKTNSITPRSSLGQSTTDEVARGSVVSWSGVPNRTSTKEKRSSVLSCPDAETSKINRTRIYHPINLIEPVYPTQARAGAVVTSSRRSKRRSSNNAAAQAFAVATAGMVSPLEASGIMGFGSNYYRRNYRFPCGTATQSATFQTSKSIPATMSSQSQTAYFEPGRHSIGTSQPNVATMNSSPGRGDSEYSMSYPSEYPVISRTRLTQPLNQRTKRSVMIATASCLRVFNVVRHWITKYPDDFVTDRLLKERMRALLESLITCPSLLPNDQKTAAQLFRQVVTDQLVQNRIDLVDILSPIRVPSEKNFDNLAALDIAEQLTFLDFQIFRSIRSEELLNQSWMKADKEEKAKHVLLVCKRFNEVSRLVVSEIVSRPDLSDRVQCIDKWVAIANICRCLQNYNGVLQICAALVNSSIYRLKRTWDRVSKQTKQSIDRLQMLVASDGRFKSMREALHRCDPPCIPYLGMYLTDLSFIEEGALNVTEHNLVNFCKMRMIAHVIREIQQYHQTPYLITHRREVTDYLLDPTRLLDEEQTYQASLTIEPRQSINRQLSTHPQSTINTNL